MGNFIDGFVCGSLFSVMLGGLLALVIQFYKLPNVSSSIALSSVAAGGESVARTATATNVQRKTLDLNVIDIDEALLGAFRVDSVDPPSVQQSTTFGMRRFTLKQDVVVCEVTEITFKMTPSAPGHFVGRSMLVILTRILRRILATLSLTKNQSMLDIEDALLGYSFRGWNRPNLQRLRSPRLPFRQGRATRCQREAAACRQRTLGWPPLGRRDQTDPVVRIRPKL